MSKSIEGNFEWFLENYDKIYQVCGECAVVIENKRILQVFKTEHEGADWIINNGLLGKCTVQYCNGDKSNYFSLFLH